MRRNILAFMASACALTAFVGAQQPAPRPQTQSLAKLPPLFFSETWKQTGLERNVDNDVLANPNLELKLYGSTSKEIQIAPTTPNNRQDPPNLWTGICNGPVAATLRDRNNYVDLTGRAKVRWLTRSAGFHVVRPVIKLADGTWLVGDHADGDGTTENFIETEFSVSSVRWLKLDINTVTTVHAERSARPEIGRWVEKPDLSKVDEIGFADLMPGSGHGWGGFVNVGRIDVYGSPVKR